MCLETDIDKEVCHLLERVARRLHSAAECTDDEVLRSGMLTDARELIEHSEVLRRHFDYWIGW